MVPLNYIMQVAILGPVSRAAGIDCEYPLYFSCKSCILVNKEPVRRGGICRADDESAARHVTEKER